MRGHLAFLYKRLSERLWVRPVLFSVLAASAPAGADSFGIWAWGPKIDRDIVEKLLSIIAASMPGVATFAVGSMVSAHASVSSSATSSMNLFVTSLD